MIPRRSFITGLLQLVAAPAIVRAGSLMPVRGEVIAEPRFYGPALWDNAWGRGPLMDALPMLREVLANTLRTNLSHSSSSDETVAAPRQRQVVLG